jgi:hypothetical protein
LGNYSYILLLTAFFFASFLPAQVKIQPLTSQHQRIQILDAGWDYNNNDLPEILAIHEPTDSLAPSEVVLYEQGNNDSLIAIWSYQLAPDALAKFTDAAITDLDRDQIPEITATLLFQTLENRSTPQWLWVFKWDNENRTFSNEPDITWGYRGRGISYLRPRQLAVADLDRNGDDELIVVTGSPEKMILIVDYESQGLRASNQLRPSGLVTGSRPFSVAVADFDGNLRDDILVVGHGQPRRLSAYLNQRTDFREVPLELPQAKTILHGATATGDLDSDGQEEAVLVHGDGSLTLISMTGPRLGATPLDTRIENLVDLSMADIDGDSAFEMIYLQSNGTVSTNDARFVNPVTSEELRIALPAGLEAPASYSHFHVIPATRLDPARILFPVYTPQMVFIASSALGEPRPEQPPGPTPQPTAITQEAVAALESSLEDAMRAAEPEPFIQVVEGSAVYFPERPLSSDPRALSPHQTPDILLYVGDEFAKDVLGERANQFAGFRFLRKPPNMVFNFQRNSIVWQPTADHLGAWRIEYEITYDMGVQPNAGVTDSILLSDKDIIRDQILIYVNDKPRITTDPDNLSVLAGNLFAYRLQVEDRNADARIEYRIESGPEGMVFDRNGILNWRTNETHHDDYQIVLSVNDGFDKDVQTFIINVNAQIAITSAVPHVARVQQLYQYPVAFFQPGSPKDRVFSLLQAPDGMTIDPNGLITWTPIPSQIDTQQFHVRVSDGLAEDTQRSWIFVNAPPKWVSTPPRSVAITVGDTLHLSFEGRDSNKHQSLQWNLVSGPMNMTLSPDGHIVWPTTRQDLDAARYVVGLSDGIDETKFRGVIFVNSLITIASTPPDSALVGQAYTYPIVTRDENRSTLLKFQRPTVIADMEGTTAYQVELLDDKFRRDLPRYLSQYREMNNVFINKPQRPESGEVAEAARIDLKQHVKYLFEEDGRLVIVLANPEQGLIDLEDVLWELFQGGRGIMPKYEAERIPFVHYSLRDFPDGMKVNPDGQITWTPTPSQSGYHQVRLTVSDGYTRDEQVYQIYANYSPAILSQADTLATVDQRYIYRVQVDDKNEDAQLTYRLAKHPEGMQVDSKGVVTWIPSVEQLNWQEFIVEVSDGHAWDRQATTLFVNMLPRLISQPKPVALNNFEYSYRLVAEDLNRDPIHYKASKLPRYSDFDPRTGLFQWRPRDLQKGPNDVVFEITDSHGGVTIHEFQIHVFEDPSRRRFLFTGWPLMLAFVGVIFVLGVAVGG